MGWQMIFPIMGVAYLIINDWKTIKYHLISCEYLQIDPSVPHGAEFIEERMGHVLSHWGEGDDPHSVKMLKETLTNYVKAVKHGLELPFITKFLNLAKTQGTITEPYSQSGKAMWGATEPPEPKIRTTVSEALAKRTSELIKDGKIDISSSTVNETYVKTEPRNDNYDDYINKKPKWPN